MTMFTLVSLIAATAVLVLIPGPNVALIVATSLRHGFRTGVTTVAGTTAGVALQLVLVVLGMTAIVGIAAEALGWIRWIGVIYLIYLGIQAWRAPVEQPVTDEPAPTMFWRGCLLAVLNPKTLLFNAAFIPQFAAEGSIGQFSLVAAVFLAVLFLGDVLWAAFAGSARGLLTRYGRWHSRISGSFLIAAGIGLAAANGNEIGPDGI